MIHINNSFFQLTLLFVQTLLKEGSMVELKSFDLLKVYVFQDHGRHGDFYQSENLCRYYVHSSNDLERLLKLSC